MTAPNSRRWVVVRATRALALGMFAMAAVAWTLTPHGVVGGLALGLPVALLAPRFRRLRIPLFLVASLAVVGVQLGLLFFGPGRSGSHWLSGFIATLAVAPWLLILTFVVWARADSQV